MKLQRRDFVIGSGALALAGPALAALPPARSGPGAADGYFLSPRNPVANRDQRDLESLALRLWARPDIQAARKATAASFARVTDHTVSAEAAATFAAYVDSYCFRSMQLGINSDVNYPRVLRVYSPAGRWLGNDVPESRWGSENPDNCYRIIPIGFGGRYEIRGQRQPLGPSHVSYVLVADSNTSVTVGLLEQQAMDIAADGSFTITLDETPANGCRNHIQTTPEAMYLFIRDSMGDWRQTPDALRVERLNPPARAPLSEDELAAKCARVMQVGVAPAYYWQRGVLNQTANTLPMPSLTGPSGGLLTQMSCSGRFALAEDEAAVIVAGPLGAAYNSLVLYDMWGRTLEYRDHQTSLNDAQMAADIDGSHTFVVARRDPRVQNWLDTAGLGEVGATFRWQGIKGGPGVKAPTVDVRVVKLADLPAALPKGVRGITPAERARQLGERQRLYDRRFIDS